MSGYQVGETLRALGNRPAGMVDFLWRVPKDVEFKIGRRAIVGFLKPRQAQLHDFLGHV